MLKVLWISNSNVSILKIFGWEYDIWEEWKYLILTHVTKNWEGMDKIFPMSERSERIGKIPILAEATPKLRIGICEASEASIHKFVHPSKFFVTWVKINFFT